MKRNRGNAISRQGAPWRDDTRRNVHDFDDIEHLLHEQEFQKLVQEEGLLIALHVTILSDYPSSAITRVVRDRPVFYRICPAYAVFRFKGEDDLTDLKNVFNRQSS